MTETAAPFEALNDFIEFCLIPTQSSKTVELTQFKIAKKFEKIKETELRLVASFSMALKEIKKLSHDRNDPHRSMGLDPQKKTYFQINLLDPEDRLILLAPLRYQLSAVDLSLILSKSESTIKFRCDQLNRDLAREGCNSELLKPENWKTSDQFTPQDLIASTRRSKRKLPFAARFIIETISVLAILVSLMWIIPEFRNQYENSIQKRINDYLIEGSLTDSPAPEGTLKTPHVEVSSTNTPVEDIPNSSSRPALEDEAENKITKKHLPKVNEGEIWRFSFAGSMTSDMESTIGEILTKLNISDSKPLVVPGGIQFDFPLPVGQVLSLKTELEEMVHALRNKATAADPTPAGSEHPNPLSLVNMSWYKRKINAHGTAPGTVQAVIWISTL